MALRVFYVSGRTADGTRVDLGPFFTNEDAREAAKTAGLVSSGLVVDEVTREAR